MKKNIIVISTLFTFIFFSFSIYNSSVPYRNLNSFKKGNKQIPFDRIIITAATSSISKEVASQIHEGGIIVSPMVRENKQIIVRYTKINNVLKSEIFDNVSLKALKMLETGPFDLVENPYFARDFFILDIWSFASSQAATKGSIN